MSVALAGILMIGGLVGVAVVVIGVPVLFVLMAIDVRESKQTAPAEARDTSLRIAAERGIARLFVVAGGLFWSVATFAGLYSFRDSGATASFIAAFLPAVACLVTLIVGWYFERTTAALLALAAIGIVAWGVIYQFEMGVWVIMTLALIGPMLTASLLFWLARREQDAYERATATRPQLALVFAARSTIA
jgi:hypothetical protein